MDGRARCKKELPTQNTSSKTTTQHLAQQKITSVTRRLNMSSRIVLRKTPAVAQSQVKEA